MQCKPPHRHILGELATGRHAPTGRVWRVPYSRFRPLPRRPALLQSSSPSPCLVRASPGAWTAPTDLARVRTSGAGVTDRSSTRTSPTYYLCSTRPPAESVPTSAVWALTCPLSRSSPSSASTEPVTSTPSAACGLVAQPCSPRARTTVGARDNRFLIVLPRLCRS